MYSIASDNTDAVSVFPKGETNCWSAVILSPIFSFLTLKAGNGGFSFLGLLVVDDLLVAFLTISDVGFFGNLSSMVEEGDCICKGKKLDLTSFMEAADAFQNRALLEKCSCVAMFDGCTFGGELTENS